MSESENYKVMKNEETGADVYECVICSSKYGTQKAIRTHLTTKHKHKKKTEEKNESTNKDDDFVYETLDKSAQSGAFENPDE